MVSSVTHPNYIRAGRIRMDSFPGDLPPLTLGGIAMIVAFAIAFHVRWTRRISAIGPTILTTIGIFFCFLGIALGLMGFDPNDVRSSVPHLLEGIRTSFWSSVAGIFCALTLKFRVAFSGEPTMPAGSQEGATVADLARLLMALNKSIAGSEDSTLLSQMKLQRADSNDRLDSLQKSSADGVRLLVALNRSLAGSEESTLLGQIKLQRADSNARLDRLQKSFDEFAKNVAESNSKALIGALSDVIRDFNTKLNEQFGENFKHLNAAVEKLVTWQAQHKDQMTALIAQETQTRENMVSAAAQYGLMVTRSEKFASIAESIGALMSALETQKDHMRTLLSSLAGMVNKASDGLPQIEKKIIEMTRQIESGVKTNSEALTKVIEAANRDLNSHLRQATDESKKHVVALDKALELELQKAMESLGRQLAALSQKFVQDYTPLTDRLRQVVRMAEGIRI